MFAQNELEQQIAAQLSSVRPSGEENIPHEEEVVRRFKQTPTFQSRHYDEANLTGRLLEIGLRVSLEQISADFPERVK